MVQPAFDIGNASGAAEAGTTRLLVEISDQSLNYIVHTTGQPKLVALRQYRLYTTADRSPRDLIDEVIAGDPVFAGHAGRALIVYNYPTASIVPGELYTDAVGKAISRLLDGDSSSEFIFGEEVKNSGMKNVYRVPREIHSLLKDKLAGSQYWHIYTMLLAAETEGPVPDNYIRTVFYHDTFIAAVYRSGSLQLMQTFHYQTPEDAAYYLLLICRQFHFAQADTVVGVGGLIDSQSALHTGLLKYFPEVRHDVLPKGISVDGLLDEFPPHYFSPLLSMSLCEL